MIINNALPPSSPEEFSSRTKPILRWPGGKSRHLKTILPMIPPHVCYCEPFAGGLAVLLAKERSPVEVINDINGDLVALYLNIQRHLPEILRQIELVVSSRKLFHLYAKQPGLTEIERAIRFFIRNRTSFGGNMHSFAVAKTKGGGAGFNRERNKRLVMAAHQRLDNVVIEHTTYERCFDNYDSPESVFFCDPPYLNCKIDAYEGWTEEDLRKFRRRLERLKGKWIVTLDDCPFNRDLFQDCKLQATAIQNRSVNTRTHGEKTFGELIISPA
ncbi:MAG: DNA adenine methylase [Verrucomicrobiota bacterium]